MHRLGEMTDRQRLRVGAALLVGGSLLMILAVAIVHNFGLPEERVAGSVFVGILEAIPYESHKWFKGIGYLLAFAASQGMIGGSALVWVLNQKMTWARAAFAAFLAWMEFVVIFGIVPSEWLNFSQTDLDWSFQRPLPLAFVAPLPRWLLLGNEVTITYGAVKDAISGAYNMVMLVVAGLVAYRLQDIGKPRPAAAAEQPRSPYGRPLVKGDS